MITEREKKFIYLKKILKTDNFPHALLVSGISSKELVLNVFNTNTANHPDFIFVKKNIDSEEIKIEQIKNCIWQLSLKAAINPFKVVVIEDAHLMNIEAQSAFLKNLEEPKGKSIIFLLTNHPEILLPTILSRVQRITFPSNFEKPDNKTIMTISKIIKSDLKTKFDYVESVVKNNNLKQTLTAWLYFLREMFIRELTKNPENFLKENNIYKALKMAKDIYYLSLTTNVNIRLALENLMLELCDI